jgi:transposase-like protein
MGTTDSSTVGERLTVVGQLLGHQGQYGVVTALSRQVGVARQTLYTWREHARVALEPVFAPREAAAQRDDGLERQILTLLVEGHASERGIQRRPLRGASGSRGER